MSVCDQTSRVSSAEGVRCGRVKRLKVVSYSRFTASSLEMRKTSETLAETFQVLHLESNMRQ